MKQPALATPIPRPLKVLATAALTVSMASAGVLALPPAQAAPAIPISASASVLAAGTASIDLDGVVVTGQLKDVTRDVLTNPYVVGEVLAYDFTVKNNRAQTVTVVPVSGPFYPFVPADGAGNCRYKNLLAGASYTCTTAKHVVTQADIDAGVLDTTTQWQVGTLIKTLSTPAVSLRANVASTLGQLKISGTPANPQRDTSSNPYSVGESLAYAFTVTNTGTTSVNVSPTSGSFAPFLPADGPGNCRYQGLAAGASYTCSTAVHKVTREELDRGYFLPVTGWSDGTTSGTIKTDAAKLAVPLADPENAYLLSAEKDRGLGFHDVNADGSSRAIRNDLSGGTLNGMVEFAQSHTINPTATAGNLMPKLVAKRAALLLFTPSTEATSITVAASVNGVAKGNYQLAAPDALPATDAKYGSNSTTVVYSKRAWSVDLPWDVITPGLELTFSAGSLTGTLPASAISMGAPTELVINNIELGMLTTPNMSGDHAFINQPAASASDYFQTIPVSKLIMAQYEKVQLEKVIVANGNIYTTASPSVTNGDVYSGDLRENVGKAQVSTGINLANFGITSSAMNQSQPSLYNQRIIHHSAGLYANGRVEHGLSGGNGMATIYSSSGNELSHELGHSYGIGHYPGQNSNLSGDAATINATHHADSGWGYNAYRNLLRTNLDTSSTFRPAGTNINGLPFTQTFGGSYNYMVDAMSGGWVSSNASIYTLHTGYSAKIIQDNLKTVVPDLDYPSGYRDWESSLGGYVDAKVKNPSLNYLRPSAVGVPVVTLLGGYVPADASKAVLYPAFRSNWGNTFNYPAPDQNASPTTRVCWMDVSFLGASNKQYAVTGGIAGLSASTAVQFNINISAADKPSGADLFCKLNGVTTQYGNHIDIATDASPLPAAVTVGQEAGYSALKAVELPQLGTELESLAGADLPLLSTAGAMKLSSWRSDLGTLSASAQSVAASITSLTTAASGADKFIRYYKDSLGTTGTADRLRTLLVQGNLSAQGAQLLPEGGNVRVDVGNGSATGFCLKLYTNADGTLEARVPASATVASECAGEANEKWFLDARGAVHNVARPDLCLTAANPSVPASCVASDSAQQWKYLADGHLQSVSQPSKSLDLNRSTRKPILYGTGTGSNQKWMGLTITSTAALVLLDADSLKSLKQSGL